MKKILLLAGAMLALTAVAANAQLNLAWNDCLAPNGAGVTNVNFACNTNSGSLNIYASIIAPSGTTGVTGEQGVVDLQSAGTVLPAWWQFVQPGSCRASGSLNVNYITAPASGCMVDYFGSIGTGPLGGFGYDWGGSGTPPISGNRARIKTVSAIDGSLATSMQAGAETYIFTIALKKTQSTGTGACAGCLTPVCIVYNSEVITQGVGVGDYMLVGAATSDFVSWQGGALDQPGPYGGTGCPGATPTRNSSWGQVKALYR